MNGDISPFFNAFYVLSFENPSVFNGFNQLTSFSLACFSSESTKTQNIDQPFFQWQNDSLGYCFWDRSYIGPDLLHDVFSLRKKTLLAERGLQRK